MYPKKKTGITNPSCQYGEVPASEYFQTYTVERGDTLLSIAKNNLGDVSRAHEIAVLNRKLYPQLSQDSFLEVGYHLLLPDSSLPISSGNIFIFHRVICSIDGNTIATSEDCTNYGEQTLDATTVFEGKTKEQFKAGDCVTIVTDSYQSALLKLSTQ